MDYEKALKDLQEYFANLIIIQYRYAPENRALIKNLVNLIFANNLALQIRDLTVDVNKSIGKQLDITGKWVGVNRYYNSGELWTHPYLSFPYYEQIKSGEYDTVQGGFSSYTNFADNDGGFLTYQSWQDAKSAVNAIGDEYFKELIKLKIIKNSINHTCKNIDEAVWNWSNGKVYTTWDFMEVIYNYDSSYSTVMNLAEYKNVLPHPTGCKVTIQEI